MVVVPFYAGLLAFLFVVLSVRVIGIRRSAKVALGTGGDRDLERRVRVHANFAEYVPLALFSLALLELQSVSAQALHGLGLLLLVGRCLHAYGMSQSAENFRFRVAGMICTFTVLGIAAFLLVAGSLPRIFGMSS